MRDWSASVSAVETIVSRMTGEAAVNLGKVRDAYRAACPKCPIDDLSLEKLILRTASGLSRPVEL